MTDRIKVETAARIIGVLPQYLRQEMAAGRIDLGYVSGNKRKYYIVLRSKLENFIGRKLSDEEITE